MAYRSRYRMKPKEDIERPVSVENIADDEVPSSGQAPRSFHSPQHPGEQPSISTVPGQARFPVPRPRVIRRPLIELGTSQGIMGVYEAPTGEELDPARFEQATATYEEMRKAYPIQLPPVRPAPGRALAEGNRMASEMHAIDWPMPAASAPADATGDPYDARPGGGTPEIAPPARTANVSPAEAAAKFSPSGSPESVRTPEDATTMPPAGDEVGTSRWQEASPAPGEPTSLAGTLPAAKEDKPKRRRGKKSLPPEAVQ